MLNPRALVGYRPRKCAQIAALFVRAAGGRIDKLKLIKLLYLVERRSIELRCRPMFYDQYYSLKDGPICSNALNGINGRSDEDAWGSYIRREGDRNVFLARELGDNDADELSDSDVEIIRSIWLDFGSMPTTTLRRWTHSHCGEYTEVQEGRVPIEHFSISAAIEGVDGEKLSENIAEYRSMVAGLQPHHGSRGSGV